jgi:hypothetical protein
LNLTIFYFLKHPGAQPCKIFIWKKDKLNQVEHPLELV